MKDKNKIFSWIFYLAVIAVLVLLALQKVYDTDAWLHMGLGKYMVEHRTIPATDVFTFTGYGNPHQYVEWLFQVFLYLLYHLAGYNGLMIFKLTLWLVCTAMLWRWMKTEGVDSRWAAWFTVLSAFLLAVRWRERPELIGFCGVILYLLVLSLYRYKKGNYLYYLPAIQILWVNAHPSALLGVAIYGIILLGEGADYLWDKDKGDLRVIKALALIIPILLGASFINPYGYKSLILTYLYTTNKTVQSVIVEWRSVWYFPDGRKVYLFFAIPALLSLIPRFINPRKNLKLSDLLLFLTGLLLPCWSVRYLVFFALIALPLVGKNIYWFLASSDTLRNWWQKYQPRTVKVYWALPAIVLILGLILFNLSPKKGLWGWGLQKYAVPEKALAFVQRNQIPGRIYNKYEWGGYIIFEAYPRYLPYIDSRAGLGDVIGSEVKILEEAQVINGAGAGWEKILENRGINIIIIRSMYGTLGAVSPLVLEFLKTPQWILIWSEDASLVFLRNRPANQLWVQKFALPKTRIYNEIVAEAQYLIEVQGVTANTYYSLGWAYQNLGNYKEAKAAFIEQLKFNPLHRGAQQNLDFLSKWGY